ncbi:MAG: DUF3592 domain-containing protein [Pseudomonadota bacterium]
MTIIKWVVFLILALTSTSQYFFYRKVQRVWERLIPVHATITHSKLIDQLNTDGNREYEADIRYKYLWDGEEHESQLSILRGPQLFPQWEYEHALVERYKEGDSCEVRVHPADGSLSFLELAPLSKLSALLLPLITVGYGAGIIAWSVFITSRF